MFSKYLLVIFMLCSVLTYAQEKEIETAEFGVTGNCSMCQARIQLAASVKGVKKAEWYKNTQTLKVIYRPDKVKLIDIHNSIARAGHDTSLVKADDKAYKKLPHCCTYRENQNIH